MLGLEHIHALLSQVKDYLVKPKQYNNSISAYYEAQDIDTYCVEITFINNGTSNVFINNALQLAPTASIGFDGKKGELDVSRYFISFDTTGVPKCVVIRKFYN